MTNSPPTLTASEELQRILVDTIKSAQQGVVKGVDFAMEQIPDICTQLLAWKFAEACIYIGLLSVVVLALVAGWRILWVSFGRFEDSTDTLGSRISVSIIAPLCIALAVIPLCRKVNVALQIKLAPKVYLIEYAGKLIR
jgi:hypothetical protein